MAAIAPPKEKTKHKPDSGRGSRDGDRFAARGYGGEPDGGGTMPDRRYYTGMLVGLGAVVMLFTAFTSAYIVRKGISDDWQSFAMPPLVWLNTLVLVASSVALEMARRCFARTVALRRWWIAAAALGIAFLAGQIEVWRQLSEAGVYLRSNPSSAFFYVLSCTHGIHLLGGVVALLWLLRRVWQGQLTRTAAGVMSLYWHFMDGLWIYLLLLVTIWR